MSISSRFLRLISVSGVVAIAVTAFPVQFSASASGAQNGALYFLSRPPQSFAVIKAINLDGTTAPVQLAYSQLGNMPAFNADGTKMAWSEFTGTSAIKVANVDGTNVVTIASGMTSSIRDLQFSDDGTKIYFYISAGMGPSTIYALSPSIANQSITGKDVFVYSGNAMDLDISTNGKAAIIGTQACVNGSTSLYGVVVQDISLGTSGTTGVGTFVPGSGTCDSLTAGPGPQAVVWSADGTKLYIAQVVSGDDSVNYARTDLRINEFNEQGQIGSTFYSHATIGKEINGMSLSPDGTQIAFYVQNAPETTPDSINILTLATKQSSLVKTMTDDVTNVVWGPLLSSAATTTTTAATTASPATTVTPVTTPTTTTTVTASSKPAVVPGVTVTDAMVYNKAPAKVADGSAITVLTTSQAATSDVVSKTPKVCLSANEDLVFINSGTCVAEVVSEKSGKVLRVLRTRVIEDAVSELNVGNEIVTLAPIFFGNASTKLSSAAKRRIQDIKEKVSAAGTVLIVGHSGIMLGDTPENRALSNERAKSVVAGLRLVKAQGPFYVTPVGAVDPIVNSTNRADQAKNRRVEIVLIP